jgi:hypothetical protein
VRARNATWSMWIAVVGLLSACGDDAATADAGGVSGAEDCDDGVTITGVVKQFQPNLERQKFDTVGGVKVCVFEHDEVPCATTASSGAYKLCGVPENSEVMISFEKKDYAKALRMLTTRTEDYDVLAETAIGTLELGIAKAMESEVDLGKLDGGVVQFFAAEPANGVLQVALLGDYTAELLSPDGSVAQCFGVSGLVDTDCAPLYLDETGEPDSALTHATSKGVGAFGNVPEGKYRLRISHPELVCDQHLAETGFRANEDDEVEVRVIDEWITSQAGVFCQPKE